MWAGSAHEVSSICLGLDLSALLVVKRSAAFRRLRNRMLGRPPMPIETWDEDGLVYFDFEIQSDERVSFTPLALFAVTKSAGTMNLVLARLITAESELVEAHIENFL